VQRRKNSWQNIYGQNNRAKILSGKNIIGGKILLGEKYYRVKILLGKNIIREIILKKN
jgi:hypothetical protein